MFLFFRKATHYGVSQYADFKGFTIPEPTEGINTALLLHVNNTGETVESFRWVTNGPDLDVDIQGADIFQEDTLRDYRFRYSVEVDNLDFRLNSNTSKWLDFYDLLSRQVITAFKGQHETDVSTEVKRLLEALKKDSPDTGAALRWSVQARVLENLTITLQCLPQAAATVRRDSKLSANECPTITLDTFTAKAIFVEPRGEVIGPLPFLFARDNKALAERITQDMSPIQKGM
jgi:hypothetical protein